MTARGRIRDLAITGTFLALVGGVVAFGWLHRDAGAAELARGELAPDLSLPRIDGGTATLSSLRGKVVLVNIWATWCSPCVREMPSLQALYERHANDGLEVLGVAVDDRPGVRQPDGTVQGIVSEFATRYGITFPIALDPTGGTERRFGTQHLPTTVLIDRGGRIRAKEVGARSWDQEPFVDMVQILLQED
jgi:thiol-disulfide isomerase/thioredoxin